MLGSASSVRHLSAFEWEGVGKVWSCEQRMTGRLLCKTLVNTCIARRGGGVWGVNSVLRSASSVRHLSAIK